jgi:Domain of unknown function (DUF4157)
MSRHAQHLLRPALTLHHSAAAEPRLFVQRKARNGESGGANLAAAQAPIFSGGGHPLPDPVRSEMEGRFGQSLAPVRIHDDARAHDSAAALGAKAYAAGDHVVFGRGQFAPETPAGRTLLAHELAHTLQQGGVQLKAEGALPVGADQRLEAEADSAASAVISGGPMPSLTRISTPTIQRVAESATPPVLAAPPPVATTSGGPTNDLPAGLESLDEKPTRGAGATSVDAALDVFVMPRPKGKGTWVQDAYDEAAKNGRLSFMPIIPKSGAISAYKEGRENYRSIWLNNYGFTNFKQLGQAINASTDADVVATRAKPNVAGVITGFLKDTQGGLDIDHIVEKQLQGTSIPSNLQLLVAAKNQAAGRETYGRLAALTEDVRKPQYRPRLEKFRLTIRAVTFKEDQTADNDACYEIERIVRGNKVSGSAAVRDTSAGIPVTLSGGGVGETAYIGPKTTEIDNLASRIIPALKLTKYTRAAVPPAKGIDTVEAELDSRAIETTGSKRAILTATSDDSLKGAVGAGAAGQAAQANAAAVEGRRLKLKDPKAKLEFYYPYLSPGEMTSLKMEADGSVSGEGVIHPRISFLGDLQIKYGKDLLALKAPLDPKKFKPPFPGLTFTGGGLALQLAPEFRPQGNLEFAIGPAGQAFMTGSVDASVDGGAFKAAGTLVPAKLPGINEAKGEVTYHSMKGWSGTLTASKSKLPNSTSIDVVIGFRQEGDKVVKYATGGITTTLKDNKQVKLSVSWTDAGLAYSGFLKWAKPFPIIDNVDLNFTYGSDLLKASGNSKFNFRDHWTGNLDVFYTQKDGEPAKIFGKGYVDVQTKNKKANGRLNLDVDEAGQLSGSGKLSYQLTDKITPELGVTLSKAGKLTISGAVKVGDIEVFGRYPKEGGTRDLMKLSTSIKLPSPFPAVNPVLKFSAGVSFTYGIGPGMLTGIELSGQFDPLEEDPAITATLKGAFEIPAKVGLTGTFGGQIGLEVLGGALGATGGLDVKPGFELGAKAVTAVVAKYDKGAFSFSGKAYLDAALVLKLGIDLTATFYAGYGLLEKKWAYPVKSYAFPVGQNIRVNAGEISYSSAGGLKLPSLSDISIEPKDLDPLKMVSDIMSRKKETESKKEGAA